LKDNGNIRDEKYFYSIGNQRKARIKIKRSIFICTLKYVDTIEQAKTFITRTAKENKTASHNCWAYILGQKGDIFHCSDAGEPAGTAGKPMLNMMQSFCMSKIAAVVTRHFGGVKLGVRGLIDAYGSCVRQTLDLKPLRKIIDSMEIYIEVSYEFNEMMMAQIKKYLTRINDTSYSDKIMYWVEIEVKDSAKVSKLLSQYQDQEKLKFKTYFKCD